MKAGQLLAVLCVSISLAAAAALSGQAPARGAAVAAPAAQGSGKVPPAAVTTYMTPEARQDARFQALETAVDELRGQIAELRTQVSAIGSAPRQPVNLTPDNVYPRQGGKTDDMQEVGTAIQNLWRAIELLKSDLRRVNGQAGRGN